MALWPSKSVHRRRTTAKPRNNENAESSQETCKILKHLLDTETVANYGLPLLIQVFIPVFVGCQA